MSFEHEFKVRGETYRCKKMSGIVQVFVLKRAGPALGPLVAAAKNGISDSISEELLEGLSKLKDEDLEYVLAKCLWVVNANRDGGWPKITSSPDKLEFMYEDIGEDAFVMMSIAIRVMGFNFEPLFREALSALADGATPIFPR